MLGPAPASTILSLPVALPLAAFAAVAVLMAWVTVTRRDLWPFSDYPMFGKATEANAVTFFALRFLLPGGESRQLRGSGGGLADEFHREFVRLRESVAATDAARDDLVRRHWREARRLDRSLAPASRGEVTMRIGRILPNGEVVLMAKVVHAVALEPRSAEA